MMGNPVEDSVNKSSRVFGTKFLANLDGLVDGNLRRDILAVAKFIDCHSQNVSIDLGHASHLPMLSVFFNEAIDFVAMFDYPSNQLLTKVSSLFVRSEIIPEEIQSLVHSPLGHIDLVKNLKGRLPPSSPSSQILPDINKYRKEPYERRCSQGLAVKLKRLS